MSSQNTPFYWGVKYELVRKGSSWSSVVKPRTSPRTEIPVSEILGHPSRVPYCNYCTVPYLRSFRASATIYCNPSRRKTDSVYAEKCPQEHPAAHPAAGATPAGKPRQRQSYLRQIKLTERHPWQQAPMQRRENSASSRTPRSVRNNWLAQRRRL